jgi:GT2 family glycosyltransferase
VSDSAPTLPSVLAVVVVKNAAPWLRQTLASLARQTHPRLGVLAIDSGSTDGSAEILRDVLGPRRCIRMPEDHGFVGAVSRALRVPAAREADYLLLLHDDAALAPDAVERLLETAGRVRGTGIVAPKTLDWTRRGVLLDIGSAADRFGYPYSPPQLVFLYDDELVLGPCGPAFTGLGPGYCPYDGTLYYPIDWVDPATGLRLEEYG